MVRIPTFTRRSDAAAAREDSTDDRNTDATATGRATVDTAPRHAVAETATERRAETKAERRAEAKADRAELRAEKAAEKADRAENSAEAADRRDQVDDRTLYRSRAATAADAVAADQAARQATAERATAERIEADRAADKAADKADDKADERAAEDTATVEPVRRARTSMMATLGLALSVVAALGVLSGRLVAYGLAIGVVALLVSMAGMAATRRRHVAGKGDAMLGLLLSLGAVVVGALALAGALPWLTSDTDTVTRVRDWLDARWNQYF